MDFPRWRNRRYILEFAFFNVAAEHSDSPMNLVLPAPRISSSVEMDSSSGVSGIVSEQVLEELGLRVLTRINTVKIVKIWRKAQPFDSALNILGDVYAGVGHTAVGKDVEAALGCDWGLCISLAQWIGKGEPRTKNLVPQVMLSDEVSKNFLIDASTVCNLANDHVSPSRPIKFPSLSSQTHGSVPESTSQFDSLEENDFSLLGGEGCAHRRAHPHGAKARRWHLDVAERKCLDHIVLSCLVLSDDGFQR